MAPVIAAVVSVVEAVAAPVVSVLSSIAAPIAGAGASIGLPFTTAGVTSFLEGEALSTGLGAAIGGGRGAELGLLGGALSPALGAIAGPILGGAAGPVAGALGSTLLTPVLGKALGIIPNQKAPASSGSQTSVSNNLPRAATPSVGASPGGGAASGVSLSGGTKPQIGPWAANVTGSGGGGSPSDPTSQAAKFWSTGSLNNGGF
jgi:hypothetical protein